AWKGTRSQCPSISNSSSPPDARRTCDQSSSWQSVWLQHKEPSGACSPLYQSCAAAGIGSAAADKKINERQFIATPVRQRWCNSANSTIYRGGVQRQIRARWCWHTADAESKLTPLQPVTPGTPPCDP